jgi:hypothetical protein
MLIKVLADWEWTSGVSWAVEARRKEKVMEKRK